MTNDIQFTVIKFKAGWYWSKKLNKMFWCDDIASLVYEAADLPVVTHVMKFKELIEFIQNNPGDCKEHRNAISRIIGERFPLKERVPISFWDGVIYVDLDLIHSLMLSKMDDNQKKSFYNELDYALQNVMPNNYFYIEHSSSGTGVHCMFYFDCEKTQYNHDRFCKYIYDVFRFKIDEYIKDFSKMIFDETDGHKVFDDVYKRPYQKMYITCKDIMWHNVSGFCDDIEVEFVEQEIKEQELNGTFDVRFITSKKKYDTDYYDRLYIITALKKYVGDYDKCKKLWYELCEQLSLYKRYTTQQFKNMLEQNWNKIDERTGQITVLKKYGFKIDENKMYVHLKPDEHVYDRVDDILKFIDNGINLATAGTGAGKTEVWKAINMKYSEPLEFPYHKPILVIEPYNSIIHTKYDKDYYIITGSKSMMNIDYSSYKCIVTNYNHLIRKTDNGYEMINNIESFFEKFELVIVDESHIMIKDQFRSEVLIPFMKTLNNITNTKIIIQTATTLFEDSVLNIRKRIIIDKPQKCKTKVIYRTVEESHFAIQQITCLVNYYIKNGKKVYIYWKNGSLQNMKAFKNIFPDSTLIYHKRDSGSDDMIKINSEHMLGESNVIMSSVYFGVGNDLNDDIDDAAVVVIGNNIWQEDEQAKGRWRNAKNIEMCIILLPQDMPMINASLERPFSYEERLKQVTKQLQHIWEDKFNRDKSIIIHGKSYMIKDESYIKYLANMQVANEYCAQFCIKNEAFRKLGYDVRDNIKPLEANPQWMEQLQKQRDDLKNIRNIRFKEFLDGQYDWKNINKDSALESCARIIRRLQYNNLMEYIDMDKFIKSRILNYGIFLKYYEKSFLMSYECAELFSILWTRKHILENEEKEYVFAGMKMNKKEYFTACGYLIWTYYRDKDANDANMISSYIKEFSINVEAFMKFEEPLVQRFFVKHAYSKEYNDFMKEFVGSKIDEEGGINNSDELFGHMIKINYDENHLNKTVKIIVDFYEGKKKKGKNGGKSGSPKKKCTITEKFKHPEKYNLTLGQEFESTMALADYTGKSPKTIVEWRNKKWID